MTKNAELCRLETDRNWRQYQRDEAQRRMCIRMAWILAALLGAVPLALKLGGAL